MSREITAEQILETFKKKEQEDELSKIGKHVSNMNMNMNTNMNTNTNMNLNPSEQNQSQINSQYVQNNDMNVIDTIVQLNNTLRTNIKLSLAIYKKLNNFEHNYIHELYGQKSENA
jgi:hypothetical protein